MEDDAKLTLLPRGGALAAPGELRHIAVTAGDGLHLVAQSCGDASKPAILFIHGFGQCHLCWLPQLRSDLARSFHLVTYDLRGHGASGKPPEPRRYATNRIWADDVEAVMDAAGIGKALLVAWSFGGRVALDYLAEHGASRVAGLNLVDANISDRPGLRGTGSSRLRPLMASPDLSRNIAGTREFLRRCFHVQPDELTFEEMLAYNMVVPPEVRPLVLGRPSHGEEVLRRVDVPVLVTFGERDQLVTLAGARYAASTFRNARLSLYADIGHAPFFEAAERFNRELEAFAREIFHDG